MFLWVEQVLSSSLYLLISSLCTHRCFDLVGFAFKSPRPGVSLGFSFFLLILAILYCVIGNVVRYWLSESEHNQRDNESGIYESKESIMMISSL